MTAPRFSLTEGGMIMRTLLMCAAGTVKLTSRERPGAGGVASSLRVTPRT